MEQFDLNENGVIDTVGIDANENGAIELYVVDENEDGQEDYYLLDQDENADQGKRKAPGTRVRTWLTFVAKWL